MQSEGSKSREIGKNKKSQSIARYSMSSVHRLERSKDNCRAKQHIRGSTGLCRGRFLTPPFTSSTFVVLVAYSVLGRRNQSLTSSHSTTSLPRIRPSKRLPALHSAVKVASSMTEPKEADVWSQIVLPAEGSCKQFTPHKLKPNYCVECNKLMASHTRAAIGSAEALLRGMEYSQVSRIRAAHCCFSYAHQSLPRTAKKYPRESWSQQASSGPCFSAATRL